MKTTLPTLATAALAAILCVLEAQSAMAQTVEKKVLTGEGAKRVVAAAVAEARRSGAGGAIAVVDDGGALLYLERLDGTFPAAAAVALKKARTAATFRKATRDFENAVKSGRLSLLAVPEMTPLQGGVPILVDGQVVGAVGVSGAMSAPQDDEIALAGAKAIGMDSDRAAGADVAPAKSAGAFVLSLDAAKAAGSAAAAEARKNGSGGAIVIVDEGSALLYAERLDNTFPAAASVAARKARTAATFRKSTKDFEDAIKAGRASLAGMADEMTPLQGGVPIFAGGRVVGAIGVTGASSPQLDEDIAKAGAAAVGGK